MKGTGGMKRNVPIALALVCASPAALAVAVGPARAHSHQGHEMGLQGPAFEAARKEGSKQLARGRRLYGKHCASCHGIDGEGQDNWRQRKADGTFPAPPHDEAGHTWHHSDRQIFAYTKFGGQAVAPKSFKSAMPAFGKILGDRDIWAIIAHIKTFWPKALRDKRARGRGNGG